MRLTRARVRGYRSVIDSGWFDIECGKTILVGPNEAGKTAILQALQMTFVCRTLRTIYCNQLVVLFQ